TSPLHRQYKLKMSQDEVLEAIAHNVAYAKKYLSDIEFSAEDACRTEPEFLAKTFEAAIKAGATTLNIPDTVGYMAPDEYAALVRYLREHTPGIENVTLSCHCHNDLGMAVANSLAGVEAGINQIECTINGIGERAGNASMEECVMALHVRRDYYQAESNIDTTQIYRASRMIQTITGVPVAPTKPIIGANAFAHESGIHQHGVMANKETYEIMTPESVGIPQNAIVLGKHSGRHAFEDRLRTLGYQLDAEKLDKAFAKFKLLADKKKIIKDRDLEALVGAVPVSGSERYTLVNFVINSGNSITSTAVIRVKHGDETIERVAASDGPINAAFRAINKIVGREVVLEDYSLKAMTEGEDAQGEAIVKISVDGSELVTGRGVAVDVIEASIKAYINGINKFFME
ncbi:MAG: 2-isopropylmalate synthase, partial [Butyricicoccus pullicaecorum]|nr:2-isopropylmalate synthase [Butyricicoccus pullicaecorum]